MESRIIEISKAKFDSIASRQRALETARHEAQLVTDAAQKSVAREQAAFSEVITAMALDDGADGTVAYGKVEAKAKDGKFVLELTPQPEVREMRPTSAAASKGA